MDEIILIKGTELKELIESSIRKTLLDFPITSKFDDSKPLRLKEAAKFLGLAETTLYTLVYQKKLKPMKPGKHLLFSRSGLQAYVNGEVKAKGDEIDPSNFLIRNKRRLL